MIARIFKSRLFVGVASAATAIALIGGVAYAVTVVQPSSSDKYYACFSNTDYLKGKIYLNMAPPTCPAVTDVVRSWDAVKGAVGATGPSGSNGVAGATGPSGATGSGGISYRPVNLCTSIPGPYMNFSTCENHTNWSRLDLHETIFRKVNFQSIYLRQADLTGADFTFADFDHANVDHAKMAHSLLTYAILDHTNLTYSDLTSADLREAVGTGTDLTGANLQNASLELAQLTDVNLTDVDLSGANLSRANLSGAASFLSGSILSGTNLSGANLSGVQGRPSVLLGVTYSNTICPTGVNSDTNHAPLFDCYGQWL